MQERCALEQRELVPLLSGDALPARLDPKSSSHEFVASVQSDITQENQVGPSYLKYSP